MNTPVLLITFNRPDYTRRVLEAILEAEPIELYVFQDGAREGNENDAVKCVEVRQVIEEALKDVNVVLHTNYNEKNLGCGYGPASAISWFFENVEQGIILEDDCLPGADFFLYCDELLDKYSNDNRIGFIGGSNYGYLQKGDGSYTFGSGHHQTWGWATWKTRWALFDYELLGISSREFDKYVRKYYKSLRQRVYWKDVFYKVKKDQIEGSCWDYQFYFSIWKNEMLAICPKVNLVSNVGYGTDATHTKSQANPLLMQPSKSILPLIHPQEVVAESEMDDYLMREFIIPYEYGVTGFKRFPYTVNRIIKLLFDHQGPWIKRER